jgi:hypothetical protein
VGDRRDDFEPDGQRRAHRAHHGVLDEAEEARLHPVPDQRIRDTEHQLLGVDGQWGDPGKIGLPDRVGDLFAQGLGA